jgi:anti-anti-sigma regulatory factor/anti-sigma regulatory factor (Ser/Thr protein kinase)
MPTEVRHLIDSTQPYPVLRLVGVLDSGTVPHVRSALLTGLAEQPEAIVVDVCDLSVADPAAVLVLRDVADETAEWPAARIVLRAPSDDDSIWKTAGLPVWSSRTEALAALGTPQPTHHLSLTLDPVVGAARRARQLVTEACSAWDLPELAGPACIVVTEMVNNVVAHARTPMTVRLALRGDTLTVAVHDHSRVVPRFTGPVAATSYGGRGLLLIDSVARRWGNLQLEDGKVVWAILHREDQSMDAPVPSRVAAEQN